MSSLFADRLDPATYRDDPLVGVYQQDASEADALWIPESIMRRLVRIAEAYELRSLGLVGAAADVTLGRSQCRDLLDEVEFIANLVDDPLLVDLCSTLERCVAAKLGKNQAADLEIVFARN